MKPSSSRALNLALVTLAIIFQAFHGGECGKNPGAVARSSFVREEILSDSYRVRWEPNFETETINFRVTVQTTGFVGFGLSPNGGMTGADIVIGGVDDNGSSYFKDYHGFAPTAPIEDESQDWTLLSYLENSTHTELEFTRPFDTCDENDLSITEASTHFIWSFGTTDRILYHGPNRGQSTVNILDPPMPEADLTNFEQWNLTRTTIMPTKDTSYWCTMHRRPTLVGKRHIVAFDAWLPTPEAIKHSHHITISRCIAPPGTDADELFGPFVGHPGEECYDRPSQMPLDFCTSIFFIWAVGGKVTMFPDYVGYPINEPGHEKEYAILEVHYDNPDLLSNVTLESGITIYHTDQLREQEAGILLVAHEIVPTHIIPPHSTNYTTVGHCSPNCTRQRIPAEGIRLYNILLHSHLAGRKLKLRHYRNGTELPWIANDDHYNFDFQQNRPLREERVILPGDQLTYECVTDTMERNTTTLAGLSTRHEMCEALIWFYPRQDIFICTSSYADYDKLFEQFGIQNMTWDYNYYDPTVTAPPEHAGKLFSQVLDEYEWTDENKAVLEAQLRFSKHAANCAGETYSDEIEPITYPELDSEEYRPPQVCNVTVADNKVEQLYDILAGGHRHHKM